MGDSEECRRLRREIQRLEDCIDNQSKRHAADLKSLREDLSEEVKYSKKLRAELEEEYKYCEKLRAKLAEKTRLVEDLREDLDDERAYSEKLERKLDKRAKIIKELEADLLDLEDDYAEARTALKRMDQLRRELDDEKLHRLYEKQRVKKLEDEVNSLRSSTSHTSSPYLSPAYTTLSPRYVGTNRSPAPQMHVLSTSPRPASPANLAPQTSTTQTPALLRRIASPPQTSNQTPALLRRIASPPSRTPELESDYSDQEQEDDFQDGRLTEEEVKERLSEVDEDASEYSDAEDPEAAEANETPRPADAPGQNLRELAAREGRLVDREYDRASEAYAAGDKEFAKKLREAAAQHRHNMRNYHRMAAAEIFNYHNPEYDLNPNARVKIDLHHLFVREAKEYVERHLDLCRRAKLQRTEIISGRGNHSIGGVAKIRPAIMELLESQPDVEVNEHETLTNPGWIVVRFLDSGRPEDNHSRGASSSRSQSRVRNGDGDGDGPRHAEVEDVFEQGQGRTRSKAATRKAAEVRQGLDEIEKGMNTMQIKSETRTRRGLRDVTNIG